MIRRALLFLLVAGFCCPDVRAQVLPPAKRDGFVYPPGRVVDPETILIEVFFDPVCPDSRDAWSPLKLALDHYGSRVAIVVHLLPLPFHDNAFVASRALHIVNALDANATFKLLEGFFKHQALFYNAQTQLMSRPAVVEEIVKLGTFTLGNSYHSALKSGFIDKKSDLATRVSFKYSTSRGVSATPTYYINGFVLPNAGSPIDFEGLRNTIDPLVGGQEVEETQDTFVSFLR
ncbi:PREDICTED: uncharacterized protein LOC104813773 [Tarenaya hassleriana]|uniref:uncharacterized protein LOC104813773 n=1 Tax=Tarenaya hassleriana TaxID=28532 RepID=UPI00053C7559|nr:PREDICTED: uncharacterized protein LOC104813773 [Tarenaya hassleriana]